MEYRYNPKDKTFYSFADSSENLFALLGIQLMNWSDKNIEEIVREAEAAEDFAFLCEMGITPNLELDKI